MSKLRTRAKQVFLGRIRRQRLNAIAVLPSMITLLNAVAGLASIVYTSKGHFATAATMIFLAMIADMLDGRVARMSKSTSSFGGQLDSLCDVISFGLAPAFLMLYFMEYSLSASSMSLSHFTTRFLWLVTATYMSCAAIRLARFNVENEEDESAHMSFTGLPSPAAAGVVASIVLFHQEVLPDITQHIVSLQNSMPRFFELCTNAVKYAGSFIIIALPFITLGAGLLMVSRIRYPHVVNQYLKGKKPFSHLIKILIILALFISFHQTVLLVFFCGFALSGIVRWLLFSAFRKKQPENNHYDQDYDNNNSTQSQPQS